MKKINLLQMMIVCVFLFTALSAQAEDNILSATDKYQDTFKNEYDMKNRTGTLDYVTPTQDGNKYDHGTVEVEKPKEPMCRDFENEGPQIRPVNRGGYKCPPGYGCVRPTPFTAVCRLLVGADTQEIPASHRHCVWDGCGIGEDQR